MTSKIRDSLYS